MFKIPKAEDRELIRLSQNLSYFLLKCLCTVFFILFLGALSLCNSYKNISKQRDDAREDSRKGAYEYCDLHIQLRGCKNELYYANERLQEAENGMDDERRRLSDTIQELNDQHLVAQEEVRSLEQHVSNTECDRDEYGRMLDYASREKEKLARDIQELEREKHQLEASLVEKDETINDFQAHQNDTVSEPVAAVSQSYINTQPNDEIEVHTGVTTVLSLRDTALGQEIADGRGIDAHPTELEILRGAHAKCGENLEHQVAAKDGELSERDDRIKDLEQQNGTLTFDVGGLRAELKNLSDTHGDCSGHLQGELARKDEELETLRAEKKRSKEDSAKDIGTLRTKLGEKEQEVTDLRKTNETLVADSAASADTTQRLNTLSDELEQSRSAHAQCDENSISQRARIGQLVTAKEQLEETLQLKNDEFLSLQGQATLAQNELVELQEEHARCGEHANTQGSEITQLRNEIGALQENNGNLSRQNMASQELQLGIQREVRSLQGQNQNLGQTVEDQRQRIHTLETNCPTCQTLREALNEVVKDVEMSDEDDRVRMEREIRESVRAELRSQVTDDLRRQVRGEVEREFRSHYSGVLDRNSKRIKEQDQLILQKNAELQKIKNAPTVNHVACERRETNLQSTVTKLQQNAKIAREKSSRSSNEARLDREQLNGAQTTIADLRTEFETIKADQRRAQNINPLQNKLATCQRDLKNMKDDRDKVRDNCSTYSKLLSDEKKKCKALEDKLAAAGDSMMDGGRTEETVAGQDEQQKAIAKLQTEVAKLSKELEERIARDNAQSQAMNGYNAPSGDQSVSRAEGEQQVSIPARRFGPRPARLPARQPTPKPVAGRKREHDEFSDGEADDEGEEDRKVKIEEGIHLLGMAGNRLARDTN